MRLVLRLLVLLFISAGIAACDSDEPSTDISERYYVRYTALVDSDRMVDMYFTDTDGESTLVQTKAPDGRLQYSVGPVPPGFTADLTVSYNTGGAVSFLSIEVAKGSEPFVLKAKGQNYYSLKYIVE